MNKDIQNLKNLKFFLIILKNNLNNLNIFIFNINF